jgi:serine/threonine protein phosphatase PrpC
VQARDVLAEDELLIVVSDGVFDVFDDSFEAAEGRLANVLDPELSCRQIADRIVDFSVGNAASDDVTALVLRRVAAATRPTPGGQPATTPSTSDS